MVELEAEPGAVGNAHIAGGVDRQRLGEHLVARRRGPAARGVVRELQVRAVRDRGGEVEVRQQADSVPPRVGDNPEPSGLCQCGDLAHLEDAFGEQRVRLEDVVAAALDEQPELVQAMVILATSELEPVELVAQTNQTVPVVAWQRLFEPEDPEPLKLTRYLERAAEAPRAVSVEPRLDASL